MPDDYVYILCRFYTIVQPDPSSKCDELTERSSLETTQILGGRFWFHFIFSMDLDNGQCLSITFVQTKPNCKRKRVNRNIMCSTAAKANQSFFFANIFIFANRCRWDDFWLLLFFLVLTIVDRVFFRSGYCAFRMLTMTRSRQSRLIVGLLLCLLFFARHCVYGGNSFMYFNPFVFAFHFESCTTGIVRTLY